MLCGRGRGLGGNKRGREGDWCCLRGGCVVVYGRIWNSGLDLRLGRGGEWCIVLRAWRGWLRREDQVVLRRGSAIRCGLMCLRKKGYETTGLLFSKGKRVLHILEGERGL